ncbi:hypothetical protein BHC59_11970 [Snodgrassella alvi]|uniref:hypothetical protein n=1 Tax=Snodgrassella alvi TaxID=1196083 RepID=UPI000C1E8A95|nr:hypothetical protein [Snodgrassella alvi]PIT54984.1 hypothetical protein BHC59_11970 [Snodgrassella alvi]
MHKHTVVKAVFLKSLSLSFNNHLKMIEHQIVAILKEAEASITVKELCRKLWHGEFNFLSMMGKIWRYGNFRHQMLKTTGI